MCIIDNLEKLNSGEAELDDVPDCTPSCLYGYAREAAVKELLANWRAAVACGEDVEKLLADIGEVIKELRHFEAAAQIAILREKACATSATSATSAAS